MTDIIAQWLQSPIPLSAQQKALLILPLCLAIAIVYKATRLEQIRELPRAALGLWVTIVVGMYAVGVGLWVVYRILA